MKMILILAVLLTGCATGYLPVQKEVNYNSMTLDKAGVSQQDQEKDLYECQQEAAYYSGATRQPLMYGGLFGMMQLSAEETQKNTRLFQCMKARGYQAVTH